MKLKPFFSRLLPLAALFALQTVHAGPADFTLSSPADGKTFKLSAARGKFVALHFLLKTECPFCLRHTRDYAAYTPSAPEVVQVFIKPDDDQEIKEWAAKANAGGDFSPVTIYRDPEARLAEQFNIPGGYSFHGQTVHYPALVLLDPSGQEVFRYVGKNNTDRFGVAQFKAKLAELQQKPARVQEYNLSGDRLALEGYDPVSYFTGARPQKGRDQITTHYRGVNYHFASPENKKLFEANPAKYAPAYGGWCATAMAKGDKVEVEPDNYKITNGRLFLFFKAFYADAKKTWNKDESALTAQADAHWKQIAGE